ncbi:MAG: recombinase family protein [Bacteroidales bacterium]|nr:recombinase family protein [Bacteroidales bacterium]
MDRLQIIATDDNPKAGLVPGTQTVEFVGKDNHPKKGKKQRYELIPSIDVKRVEGVGFLFQTAREQFPALSPSQLARKMAAAGYTSFRGISFDPDNLLLMLEDETYVGHRPYGKRSVARHKRWNKHVRDDAGLNLEDVPDDSMGKVVWREKDDQFIPVERIHDALVDESTFAVVQELLRTRPKKGSRRGYAPKSDDGWLKPILFCVGCGRGMKTTMLHKRRGYCCQSYQMRYQRPGDQRFGCTAGFNSIRHDELEALLGEWLDQIEGDFTRHVELDTIKRLEEEVARHEALAVQHSTIGYRNHLRLIWEALSLDNRPGPLATLIEGLLRTDDPKQQLEGLTQAEQLLFPVVQQALDQASEQHRNFTISIGRRSASPRQVAVWEEECRKLETKMETLERLRSPLREQIATETFQYQEKLDQLADARRAVAQGNGRVKGAAFARFFSRIYVAPVEKPVNGQEPLPRQLDAFPFWSDDLRDKFVTVAGGVTSFNMGEARAIQAAQVTGHFSLNLLSVHGSPWKGYWLPGTLSQKPGRSSVRNSMPRTHFTLFQLYKRGITNRTG